MSLIKLKNSLTLYSPAFLYAGAVRKINPVAASTPRVASTGVILSSFLAGLLVPLKERPLKDESFGLLFKGLSLYELNFKDMNSEGTFSLGDRYPVGSFRLCRIL